MKRVPLKNSNYYEQYTTTTTTIVTKYSIKVKCSIHYQDLMDIMLLLIKGYYKKKNISYKLFLINSIFTCSCIYFNR